MESLNDIERSLINIVVSGHDPLPDCMLEEIFSCTDCVFDQSRRCQIYNNWEIRSYLKYRIANLPNSLVGIDSNKQEIIVNAIATIMLEHGRELPLYLDKISRMTLDRYPQLQVNRNQIGIILKK